MFVIASIGLAAAAWVLPLTRVFVAATPATGFEFRHHCHRIAGAPRCSAGGCRLRRLHHHHQRPTARGTNGVAFSIASPRARKRRTPLPRLPLPTGLVVSTTSGKITGTPTVEGVFVVLLTASDSGIASRTVNKSDADDSCWEWGRRYCPKYYHATDQPDGDGGRECEFSVVASGTAPLSYQWRLGGANIAGATSATLTLDSVTTGQSGGSYTCAVSNTVGTATSSAATLTVNPRRWRWPSPPTHEPDGNRRANVSFTVAASGTAR